MLGETWNKVSMNFGHLFHLSACHSATCTFVSFCLEWYVHLTLGFLVVGWIKIEFNHLDLFAAVKVLVGFGGSEPRVCEFPNYVNEMGLVIDHCGGGAYLIGWNSSQMEKWGPRSYSKSCWPSQNCYTKYQTCHIKMLKLFYQTQNPSHG